MVFFLGNLKRKVKKKNSNRRVENTVSILRSFKMSLKWFTWKPTKESSINCPPRRANCSVGFTPIWWISYRRTVNERRFDRLKERVFGFVCRSNRRRSSNDCEAKRNVERRTTHFLLDDFGQSVDFGSTSVDRRERSDGKTKEIVFEDQTFRFSWFAGWNCPTASLNSPVEHWEFGVISTIKRRCYRPRPIVSSIRWWNKFCFWTFWMKWNRC